MSCLCFFFLTGRVFLDIRWSTGDSPCLWLCFPLPGRLSVASLLHRARDKRRCQRPKDGPGGGNFLVPEIPVTGNDRPRRLRRSSCKNPKKSLMVDPNGEEYFGILWESFSACVMQSQKIHISSNICYVLNNLFEPIC